ncbi:hypothetical protein ACHAPC_003801 [Botrytis cinerea]|uniref:Thioester reductase (TE) domain-containing protein n=1 Tax=Botryotinia fuckeliana (strain T4) TaxID=999810 RepID=G2Y8P7_BOTF4|nr:hypothetical protein BofuT4_P028490.1 [Botrytis cinerea T4]
MGYRTSPGSTPKNIIHPSIEPDKFIVGPNGYAESKYISKLLISYASDKFLPHGYEFSLTRVGQIAGPVRGKGLWNKTEWFPSLVLSCIHLCSIPSHLGSSLGKIDWVPVDILADIIADLALTNNVQHEVRQDVELKAGAGTVLKDGELDKILENNPAAKLLEFYEDVLGGGEEGNVLETEKTKKASKALNDFKGVKREWIAKWISE